MCVSSIGENIKGVPRNGGPKATGLIVFYSQFSTCSNPRVDRCSNPFPWDPHSSPSNEWEHDAGPAAAAATCAGSHCHYH